MDLINGENELVELHREIFFQAFINAIEIINGKAALQPACAAAIEFKGAGMQYADQLLSLEYKRQPVQWAGIIDAAFIIEVQYIGFEGSFFFQFEIVDKGIHISGAAACMLLQVAA